MPTATFLSNATVNITQGATTYDVSDQCSAVTLTVGNEPLETTAFTSSGAPTGRTYTAGLQSVEVSLTMYLSYGGSGATSEVETALAACVGKSSTLVISPSGTTESATNPEYTITDAYLESFTPINSTIGELATVEVTFTGGTFARDIT